MKYILLVALLFVACGHEQVELTLRNACMDASQAELMLNDEIILRVNAGQIDNEFIDPDTYIAELSLHKDGWPYTIIIVDTVLIDRDMTCLVLFYNETTQQEELVLWE
jgi:hypothetical protein